MGSKQETIKVFLLCEKGGNKKNISVYAHAHRASIVDLVISKHIAKEVGH